MHTRVSSIHSAFLLLVTDLAVGLQTELYLRAVISLEHALVLSSEYLLDFHVRSVFFDFRNMADKFQYCSSADFTPRDRLPPVYPCLTSLSHRSTYTLVCFPLVFSSAIPISFAHCTLFIL